MAHQALLSGDGSLSSPSAANGRPSFSSADSKVLPVALQMKRRNKCSVAGCSESQLPTARVCRAHYDAALPRDSHIAGLPGGPAGTRKNPIVGPLGGGMSDDEEDDKGSSGAPSKSGGLGGGLQSGTAGGSEAVSGQDEWLALLNMQTSQAKSVSQRNRETREAQRESAKSPTKENSDDDSDDDPVSPSIAGRGLDGIQSRAQRAQSVVAGSTGGRENELTETIHKVYNLMYSTFRRVRSGLRMAKGTDFCPPDGFRMVDALPILEKGTAFLKFGRKGNPHLYHFKLSADHRRLCWWSHTKKKECTILLRDVTAIELGQMTEVFRTSSAPPALALCSLSLIYFDRDQSGPQAKERSLDLIATDAMEFELWTKAVAKLSKCGDKDGIPAGLLVDVSYHKAAGATSYTPVAQREVSSLRRRLRALHKKRVSDAEDPDLNSVVTKATRLFMDKPVVPQHRGDICMDCLGILHEGTLMIKSKGNLTQWALVYISEDNQYLHWAIQKEMHKVDSEQQLDKPKPDKNHTIAIADIIGVAPGQNTSDFKRPLNPRYMAEVSFSVFASGGRWLSVIAPSQDSFELWFAGLTKLVRATKKRAPAVSPLDELLITIRTSNIRSHVEYHDDPELDDADPIINMAMVACGNMEVSSPHCLVKKRYFSKEKEGDNRPSSKGARRRNSITSLKGGVKRPLYSRIDHPSMIMASNDVTRDGEEGGLDRYVTHLWV